MQPANKFQDYKFNGKGSYSLQLDHVSLVDGHDDTFIGLNAGTKLPSTRRLSRTLPWVRMQ